MVKSKRIVAVDLGLVRTGIAVSDLSATLASPLVTITERNTERLLAKVAQIITEQQAATVVIGHPRNMDGSCGESAKRAESFADQLKLLCQADVLLWDERMTTVTAIGYLNESDVRGKKRKAVVDSVAATIILQDYLESLRLAKQPSSEDVEEN